MLRKISTLLFTLFTLVAFSLSAFGETASVQSDIKISKILTSSTIDEFLTGTNYIKFNDSKTGNTGIMQADGTVVVPAAYLSIDNNNFWGYYTAVNDRAMNSMGVIDAQGNVLVPFSYGDIEFISADWCVGVRLTEATGDNYDYSSFFGNGKYLVLDYTFYDMKTKTAAGTLDRMQYDTCKVFGDYLYIEDRNGQVSVYDKNMNVVGTADYVFSGYTSQKNNDGMYDVIQIGSNEKILTTKYSINGFVEDTEFIAVKRGGTGLMDFDGNLLIPCEYDGLGYTVRNGYIEVELGGKKGLSDLKGNLIVDAKYDSFEPSFASGIYKQEYFYFVKGYCPVTIGEKFGYVNDQGQETCPVKYSKNAKEINACSAVLNDMEGNMIIVAADGIVTTTEYKDVGSISDDLAGRILWACDQNDKYGIIDWHGNLLLPFEYDYSFQFSLSPFGDVLIVKGNSYKTQTVVYTVQ